MAGDQVTTMMAALKKMQARYLRFELPDLHGTSRTKVVPIDKVEAYARKGLNFYGGTIGLDSASGVIGGTGVAEEVAYRDQSLIPDPGSLRPVPWLPGGDAAAARLGRLALPGVLEPAVAHPVERARGRAALEREGEQTQQHALVERQPLFPEPAHSSSPCSAGVRAAISSTTSVPVPSSVPTPPTRIR